MSFQAYLDNIEAKTGKSPADFKKLAKEKESPEEFRESDPWLKKDFELGHGHAMAIVALLKGKES